MPSNRRSRSVRTAAGAFAMCAALAASATPAMPEPGADYLPPTTTKIGDTPADFPQPVAPSGVPASEPGDTPEDSPGASRAPSYEQPIINVVRPERTIVRRIDPLLPTVLAGAALLLALAAAVLAAIALRSVRRVTGPGSAPTRAAAPTAGRRRPARSRALLNRAQRS